MSIPNLVTSTLYIASIVSVLSIIFIERKNPQTTIAWVMVMMFFPIFGVILYLVLGTSGALTFFFRRRIAKKTKFTEEYAKLLYSQLKLGAERKLKFKSDQLYRCLDIIRMHLSQNGSLFTDNNKVVLFTNVTDHYHDLFTAIAEAKHHINIEYFIIQNDIIGNKFIRLLAKKAKEGVEVRLLYDEFGSVKTKMSFFAPIIQNGGKVHRFYTTRLANLCSVNHRNHRKIVVIDGTTGYTGGTNIGDEYMGLHKRIKPWRDTHLKLMGGSVAMLQLRFLLDWSFCTTEVISFDDEAFFTFFFPAQEFYDNIGVQIVSSGPDASEESIKNGYMKMINNAKETLYIQTPYLIPDEPMLQSLRIAAASGVDVRVMIPGIPDKNFVYAITLSYVGELLKSGVRVYFHEGFIHAKTIVMDTLVSSIGTTNFDIRSFALNFEVNAFIYDEAFADQCKQVFFDDMANCTEMTDKEFSKRGTGTKIFESICRLLAYLS